MLNKVKNTPPLGKQSNVVYHIPCSCDQVYMVEKSAVAEHAWENHHPINWETTVLDHGMHGMQRTGAVGEGGPACTSR